MNTAETIEKIRKFLVVVRIAHHCNKVRRGKLPGQLSLLRIATEDFDLTYSQYQGALLKYRNDLKKARARLPLAA